MEPDTPSQSARNRATERPCIPSDRWLGAATASFTNVRIAPRTTDIPRARDFLQHLGDVFSEARQFGAVAALADTDDLRFMHHNLA